MQDLQAIFLGSAPFDSGQKLILLGAGVGVFLAVFGGAIGLLLLGLLPSKSDASSH